MWFKQSMLVKTYIHTHMYIKRLLVLNTFECFHFTLLHVSTPEHFRGRCCVLLLHYSFFGSYTYFVNQDNICSQIVTHIYRINTREIHKSTLNKPNCAHMQHYIAVYIATTRLHKSSFTFNTLFCSCTLPSNAQLPGLPQTDSYSDYYYYVLHMQSRAGPRELNKQKPKSKYYGANVHVSAFDNNTDNLYRP